MLKELYETSSLNPVRCVVDDAFNGGLPVVAELQTCTHAGILPVCLDRKGNCMLHFDLIAPVHGCRGNHLGMECEWKLVWEPDREHFENEQCGQELSKGSVDG